jgi:glycolate oxidase FAD binding subunit
MIAPEEEAGFATAINAAVSNRAPLTIEGLGSKAGFLHEMQTAETLSTRNHVGIPLYAPQELIITTRTGTTLAAVEAKLAEGGQHLIAEPPHYAFLDARAQTIGGVVAANLSGPRRVAWGATRDHVMGMRAVTGRGDIIRSGGPKPQATGTVVLHGLQPDVALRALASALGSPFSVSGAAFLPQEAAMAVGHERTITIARIEDFADSVTYRTGRLAGLWAKFGTVETLETAASVALWRAVR